MPSNYPREQALYQQQRVQLETTKMMRVFTLHTNKEHREGHDASPCGSSSSQWWVKRREHRDQIKKKTRQKWFQNASSSRKDTARSHSTETTAIEEDSRSFCSSQSTVSRSSTRAGPKSAASNTSPTPNEATQEEERELAPDNSLDCSATVSSYIRDKDTQNTPISALHADESQSSSNSVEYEPHLVCNNGACNLRHAGQLVMNGSSGCPPTTQGQNALHISQEHPPTDATAYRIIIELDGVDLKNIRVAYAPGHKRLNISASRTFGRTRFFQRAFLIDTYHYNPKDISACLYKGQLTVVVPSREYHHG